MSAQAQAACEDTLLPIAVQIFRSTFANGKAEALIQEPNIAFGDPGSDAVTDLTSQAAGLRAPASDSGSVSAPVVIRVNSNRRFQKMNGFGAAMTEACAINMMRLPQSLRDSAMNGLFSKIRGAGFDYIRLPIGASDFTDPVRGNYTYDDSPGNRPDPRFRHFSMARDEKSFQLIREAVGINPDLKVMISPWSPPAWMKTPKSLLGGKLNPAHYRDFAKYLVRVIREYKKRSIPVDSLTIQNEPGYANDEYPSMGMEAGEQIVFIRDYLAPALKRAHLKTGIFVLDHNYDMFADVNSILDDAAVKSVIKGVAYHCYNGDYTQMKNSNDRHPDVGTFQTECTGMLGGDLPSTFAWWLNNYSLAPANMGSTGSMAWNLCLDQDGGPHNKGCEGCGGLVTADFSDSAAPKLSYAPEYHALAQISRFIRHGSERIEVLNTADPDFNSSAFANADGQINYVAWNGSDAAKSIRVERSACESFEYSLPAKAAVTFIWSDSALSSVPMM